jgi:hypothetical protein
MRGNMGYLMKKIIFLLGPGLSLRHVMDSTCVLLIRIWICTGVWAELEELGEAEREEHRAGFQL